MNGSEITITVLGSGSAVPAIDRQQSCIALRHQKGLILFDCGEGSQYALRKYRISTRKEVVIWISHLHSDHFLGLPGLLASFELLNREDPITIIGPQGLHQTVQNLVLANYIRTNYEIHVVELEAGQSFQGSGYRLETIKAHHEANALSVLWIEDNFPGKVDIAKLDDMGIKPGSHISELQEGKSVEVNGKIIHPEDIIGKERRGRIVFYSGDTAYNERLVNFIHTCDLLIHESTYPAGMEELAEERSHSTVSQVMELVKQINPAQVLLTHISPRIQDSKKEILQAKKSFDQVDFAYDGMELYLEYPYRD